MIPLPTKQQRRHEIGCRAVGTLKSLLAFGLLKDMPQIEQNCRDLVAQFDAAIGVELPATTAADDSPNF